MGEVLASSKISDVALESLPASSFMSTLSFAMFRAAALYPEFRDWNQLVESWDSVRRMTGQRSRPLDVGTVARVVAIIIDAAGSHNTYELSKSQETPLRSACREMLRTGGRPPSVFMAFQAFEVAEAQMHGPREQRVMAFVEFVRSVPAVSSQEEDLRAAMLGYLVSRIAPGSIQHAQLLEPIAAAAPTASMWYGFFAGLAADSRLDLSRSESGGLELPTSARRILRELHRREDFLSPPNCDISFSELVAIGRTRHNALDGIPTGTSGGAIVELAPGIYSTVNSSKSAPDEADFSRKDAEVVSEIRSALERLTVAVGALVEEKGGRRNGPQRPLFPSKRSKR